MGKLIKKGVEGEAAQFVTKTQAMKKLQLNSQQFHKLCILKGIYPREPKKKKNTNKTYYHIKDLRFLSHDQLIDKFREIDAWVKKIHKAKIKKDPIKVQKLSENAPTYTLHHLIKERYPRFSDALNDLDDALSLVCLFASCPSSKDLKISVDMIRASEKLWHEFEVYLMASRSIRKAFLSIKGIYYQAEIKGQEVTWLVPYQFTQHLPSDVDYSIMVTFLEFYHTLMRFVNFKLYQEIGISYPPSAPLNTLIAQSTPKDTDFKFDPEFASAPEVQAIQQKNAEREASRKLFEGFTFLLGRETPKYSLELVIRSCGGQVVFEDSEQVTHQVVDRPLKELRGDREYLQPQWVYDCLNFKVLLPMNSYKPGSQLPPHLSPFVDHSKESYIPERYKEIMQFKGEDIQEKMEIENEKKEMGKAMMTKKIRNLYNRIQIVNKKKKARVERLKKRKKEIQVNE